MKCSPRRRFSRPCYLIIYALIIYIVYNEVYLYRMNKFRRVECRDPDDCLRILLVADPQLIGLHREPLPVLTPLTIWDSDRYLAKTYSIVFKHAKPHVVIFLGDLLDEGSTATNSEFEYYMKRFFDIFYIELDPSNTIKYIFIPGDNDIGGEGGERISRSSVYRFEKTFPQQQVIKYGNVSFYKVNRLTRSVPTVAGTNDFFATDTIRVVLSHMPLMFMPSLFVDEVLKKIQPHLLFTAHEHKSMIVSTDGLIQKDRQIVPISREDSKVYSLAMGVDNMYEIIVPTCSYRMGTTRIGYGLAVIESGEVRYTVLWSPSRFDQLFNYAFLGVLIAIYTLAYFCTNYRCCRTTSPGMGKRKYFLPEAAFVES